ncbi:MAG: hypothetical protein JNM43_24555 [Planctomycetaceae bacterium]|nr:hypothetical protein [Planctomycetaceae bacterium]
MIPWSLNRIPVLAVLFPVLGLMAGCTSQTEKPAAKSTADTTASAEDECQSRLATAVKRVAPESLATQSRREPVVNAMNAWMAACGETDVRALKISDANLAYLSDANKRTASTIRFSENDILYVRDAMILKGLTESVWKQADAAANGSATDKARVVGLFQHLIRNISLIPASESRVPSGLYEVMMTGRGTVDDRIWAFAEALRQRQLDMVLLKAASPSTGAGSIPDSADLLVGVFVDKTCLLFDPLRGTAVPKAEDPSALVTDPATHEILAGHDRWKNGEILAVCHPSAAAPRMLVLQNRMSAADTVVLYEELAGGTSEIRPLKDRVSEVTGNVWPAEKLKLWEVPEQRVSAAATLTEQQKQEYTMLMRPFDSPFERESLEIEKLITDPNVDESKMSDEEKLALRSEALEKVLERADSLFGRPSRRLLKARVSQISGDFELGVIQDLQQIRIACLQEKVELDIPLDQKRAAVIPFALPKSILDVQKSAVSDTLYWTALSQISRRDIGTAIATLRNYRRQYPNEKMTYPSMLNECEALVELGDKATAVKVAQEAVNDANPERARAEWLASRLAAAP